MPPRDIGSCCSSCNSCEHMRSAAVTCVWSMSMSCTGACIGERWLVATDQRTDSKQKEAQRAHLQTLLRRSCRALP